MRIIELFQASFAQCFTSAPDVVPPTPRRPTKDLTPRTSSPTNLLGYDAAIVSKTRSMAETEEELSCSPKTRPPPATWPFNWKTTDACRARRADSDTDTSSVSSTGSCSSHKAPLSAGSSYKLSTTGVSFRQLAQELAPPPAEKTDAETVAAFYLVALQLLKQERELRARLRSESGSGMEIEAEPETAHLHMQPEHEEDDEARRLRKKKLENLRQRSTRFAIAVGKPLNYTNFNDLPEDDVGPCLV